MMNFHNSPQIYSDRPLHDATSAYIPKRNHHNVSTADPLTSAAAAAAVAARIYSYPPPSIAGVNTSEPNRNHSFLHATSHHGHGHHSIVGVHGPPGPGTAPSLSHLNHSQLNPLFITPPTSHNGAIVTVQAYRDNLAERYAQEFAYMERLKRDVSSMESDANQHQQSSFYNNRGTTGVSLNNAVPVSSNSSTNLQSNSNNNNPSSSSVTSRRRPSLLPHNAAPNADAFSLPLNCISSTPSSASSNPALVSSANRYDREKYDHLRYSHHEHSSSSRKSTTPNLPSAHSQVASVSTSGPAVYLSGSSQSHSSQQQPSSNHTVSAGALGSPATSLLIQPGLSLPLAGMFHHQQHAQAPHPSSTISLQHNHLSHGHLLNEIYDISNKRPRLNHQSGGAPGAPSPVLPLGFSINANENSRAAPMNQELLIDTRDSFEAKKELAYNPHFEAISPTPNEESRNSPLQSAKDEILGNINSIDREIVKVETLISKLRKKAQELEEVTSKPPPEENLIKKESKEPTLIQKIYCENLLKATKAHQQFAYMGALNQLPLYNQPIDLAIIYRNHIQFLTFKTKLIEQIKKRNTEIENRHRYLCETYDKHMCDWLKKLEKKELVPVKKAKDQKMREYFERQFPELKKQREDRERLQRGQRIRSDADLEEIMDGLQVQELEDKKMRSYAVIPPIMYDDEQRRVHRFDNKNGLIEDPVALHKQMKTINIWTEGEKEIFREKYLQNPKKFGIVAGFLERKSVADCVQYYYLSKKIENYKQLLRKHVKKRTRALVRAQQQQQNLTNQSQQNRGSPLIKDLTSGLKPYPQSATSVILPYSTPSTSNSSTITFTISCSSTSSLAAHSSGANTATSSSSDDFTSSTKPTTSGAIASTVSVSSSNSTTTTCSTSTINHSAMSSSTTSSTNVATLSTKCDTSDNHTNLSDVSGNVCDNINCCVCGDKVENFAKSRPVNQSNLSLYGLTAADFKNGTGRVCLRCHLKNVRRQCPIPSCKTPRRKVKRLKALPQPWLEMNVDLKHRYSQELDIPMDAKIGCARCVMRISRRIGLVTGNNGSGESTDPNAIGSLDSSCGKSAEEIRKQWSDSDIDRLRSLIKEHGKDWTTISASLCSAVGQPKRSVKDCRKLYNAFKIELDLWTALKEHYTAIGKPVKSPESDSDGGWLDLDDGDSCDDTSSADEERVNSDTASASSSVGGKAEPDHERQNASARLQDLKALSASQGSLKSDYDSSATMSADEGGGVIDATGSIAASERLTSPRNPPNSCFSASTLVYGSRASTSSSQHITESKSGSSQQVFHSIHQRDSTHKHFDLVNPAQQVPTFLINPNAPSIQLSSSNNSSNSLSVSLNSSLSTPTNSMQTSATGAVKEERTCVRDLIYKAIEASLQPESRSPAKNSMNSVSSSQASTSESSSQAPSNSNLTSSVSVTSSTLPLCLKRENVHDMSKMDVLASTATAIVQAASSGGKTYKMPPHIMDNSSASNKPEGLAIMANYPYAHINRTNSPSTDDMFEVQDLSNKSKDRRLDQAMGSHRNSPIVKEPKLSTTPRSSPSLSASNKSFSPYQFSPYNTQPAHSNQSSRVGVDPYILDSSKQVNTVGGTRPPQGSPFSAPPSTVVNSMGISERNKHPNKTTSPVVGSLIMQSSGSNSGSKTPNVFIQLSPKSAQANSGSSSTTYRDKVLPPTTMAGGSITQGTPVVLQQSQVHLQQPSQQANINKFVSPSFHPGYDAMLRQMSAAAGMAAGFPGGQSAKETQGSITQGTPLIVNGPGAASLTMSSLNPSVAPGISIPPIILSSNAPNMVNRKSVDMALDFTAVSKSRFPETSLLPRTGSNFYDSVIIEQYAKINASPNTIAAQVSSAGVYHRPFSPNFAASSPYLTGTNKANVPPQLALPGKENGPLLSTNQILIDFNTSKQMQAQRSSSASDKDQHFDPTLQPGPRMVVQNSVSTNHSIGDKSKSFIHSNYSSAPFQVSPAPSPNAVAASAALYLSERGQIIRGDDKHLQEGSPGLVQWNHLVPGQPSVTNQNFVPNRQNVIQQWNNPNQNQSSTQVSKASVIQAPKSSSPRDFCDPIDTVRKSSVSPLITGPIFPPGHDAFATLVNAAVQQPSLSIPNSVADLRNSSTSVSSRLIKDSKSLTVEGFERCLLESMQHQKKGPTQVSGGRIVYPPVGDSQDAVHTPTDLSGKPIQAEESGRSPFLSSNRQKLDPRPSSVESVDQKRFSPFHLAHNQSENEKLFLMEQRKKREFAAAAAQQQNDQRFRSVEALANNSLNPSFKFAREPFSSEHFERELRQMDMRAGTSVNESKSVNVNSENESKLSRNTLKNAADMDEASKLFSQSFQKDSDSISVKITASKLFNAIIAHQMNTDSTKGPSSLGNYGLNRLREGLEKQTPPATPPLSSSSVSTVPTATTKSDLAEFKDMANKVPVSGSVPESNRSLRDTIFNVITSNFNGSNSAPSNPLNSRGTTNMPSDLSKQAHNTKQQSTLVEGIASVGVSSGTPISSATSISANENFKLRKALQSSSDIKANNSEQDSANTNNKRLAPDPEPLRKMVIQMSSSTGSTQPVGKPVNHYLEPISPPQHHSQSSGTTSASSVPSTTVNPILAQHHLTSTSNWPQFWPMMPHLHSSYYPNHISHKQSTTGGDNTATTAGSHLPHLSGHRGFDDYFPSRFAEAMQRNVSNTVATMENDSASKLKNSVAPPAEHSRSNTPKKSHEDRCTPNAPPSNMSNDAPHRQTPDNRNAYPDSPSSPGEMVIDENRASSSSPDITVRGNSTLGTGRSQLSPENATNGPITENSNDRKTESNSVIKLRNNTADVVGSNLSNSHNNIVSRTPMNEHTPKISNSTLAGPQFEPLSDDDEDDTANNQHHHHTRESESN